MNPLLKAPRSPAARAIPGPGGVLAWHAAAGAAARGAAGAGTQAITIVIPGLADLLAGQDAGTAQAAGDNDAAEPRSKQTGEDHDDVTGGPRLAGDIGTVVPKARRHRLFTADQQALETRRRTACPRPPASARPVVCRRCAAFAAVPATTGGRTAGQRKGHGRNREMTSLTCTIKPDNS